MHLSWLVLHSHVWNIFHLVYSDGTHIGAAESQKGSNRKYLETQATTSEFLFVNNKTGELSKNTSISAVMQRVTLGTSTRVVCYAILQKYEV